MLNSFGRCTVYGNNMVVCAHNSILDNASIIKCPLKNAYIINNQQQSNNGDSHYVFGYSFQHTSNLQV